MRRSISCVGFVFVAVVLGLTFRILRNLGLLAAAPVAGNTAGKHETS